MLCAEPGHGQARMAYHPSSKDGSNLRIVILGTNCMGERRRVLLVSGTYPPDSGGPASFVPMLREYLLRQGWYVEVVAVSESAESQGNGVRIVTRGSSALGRRTRFMRHLVEASRRVDVVFANTLLAEVGAACQFMRKPWVAKVVGEPIWERANNRQNTTLSPLEFHKTKVGLRNLVERRLWVESLSSASSIIVPAAHLKTLLEQLRVESRVVVVANGVLLQGSENPAEVPKDFDVATVCRLISLKRVRTLVESSTRLGFHLLVAGEGPERAQLEALAERSRGKGKVTFVGRIPTQAVPDLLKRSRVFALMSSHEGLSFALLEAKAVGLPVVASDIPGNRVAVREGIDGFLVKASDPTSIDHAIGALLGNSDLAREFGEAGRSDIAERFSLERTLASTERELIAATDAR